MSPLTIPAMPTTLALSPMTVSTNPQAFNIGQETIHQGDSDRFSLQRNLALPSCLAMSPSYYPQYFCATPPAGGSRISAPRAPGNINGNHPVAPPGTIKALPRGGALLMTSEGWVQFGVPMWTNKDALALYQGHTASGRDIDPAEIPFIIPTKYIFDLDYVGKADGFIPADFVQYMYFVAHQTPMQLVAPNASSSQRLQAYLDLSYRPSDRHQIADRVKMEYSQAAVGVPDLAAEMAFFDGVEPEGLRQISAFDENHRVPLGGLTITRIQPQHYKVEDGAAVYELNLSEPGRFPLMQYQVNQSTTNSISSDTSDIIGRLLHEKKPALLPIGTGHGFCHDEESSGFMLWNQGRAVIIDPPSSTLSFLSEHGIPKQAIAGIILTHGHSDHYGNAIPQLLHALPGLTVYTTPTIYDMLAELYHLAVGVTEADLSGWNFSPLHPQQRTSILGMNIEVDYSFHSIPTIGFDVFAQADDEHPILYFSGDTNADHRAITQHVLSTDQVQALMSEARAKRVVRHIDAIFNVSETNPIVLIDNGVPPLHTPPKRTRELLIQAKQAGVSTKGRVFSYHISADVAAEHDLPKWPAGIAGLIDLSGYFGK